MELQKELVESLGLNEDQVKGISEFGQNHVAELQKEWSGKANEQAQGILEGAATYALKTTGVKLEREKGEKHGDFLKRVADAHLEAKNGEISDLKADYETKLKEFKGGDALKSELDAAKSKLDEAKQKLADYDELKEKAEKAEKYGQELSGLKLEVAFNGIRPNFPDTVNPYEAKAKWDEFKKSVLETHNIEIVDGEPVAISKENEYKQTKLKELLAKDEPVQALLKGRQQQGTGGTPTDMEEIEGVPFKVPKDATGADRSKAIKEYLASKGIGAMHPDYSTQFSELNKKILNKK